MYIYKKQTNKQTRNGGSKHDATALVVLAVLTYVTCGTAEVWKTITFIERRCRDVLAITTITALLCFTRTCNIIGVSSL